MSAKVGKETEVRRRNAAITPVAWLAGEEMDLAEWTAAGRRLGAMGRSSQWWLGDWIRYGNSKFGEKYVRAASITGYDSQTLMNMVYVATRFDVSRRRENLSWSHHETVAALDLGEQEHWLDHASAERLSIADLRLELRSARKGLRQSQEAAALGDAGAAEAALLEPPICPNCGQEMPVAGSGEADADLAVAPAPV